MEKQSFNDWHERDFIQEFAKKVLEDDIPHWSDIWDMNWKNADLDS